MDLDFDRAVSKFERRHDSRNRSSLVVARRKASEAAKLKRELAERRRKEDAKRAEEALRKAARDRALNYMTECERLLDRGQALSVALRPVSIHGPGDKISLPPSFLARLTADLDFDFASHSPVTVRVALPDPSYVFPGSKEMRARASTDFVEEEEGEEEEEEFARPYRREIAAQFLGRTHAGVVEFTMEEGRVGLPRAVARALLHHPKARRTRTVDPAAGDADPMAMDEEEDEDGTPGHLAWGRFDVPAEDVTVKLVRLPRGKKCVLSPTPDSLRRGFDRLPDVKAALERSLFGNRSTLSVGDSLGCWHRGVRFELDVAEVEPQDFGAVGCVDTDLTVDFRTPSQEATTEKEGGSGRPPSAAKEATTEKEGGNGRPPSAAEPDAAMTDAEPTPDAGPPPPVAPESLLAEPPLEKKTDVCTVMVRGNAGRKGRRRFDVAAATLRDLFLFARTVETSFPMGGFHLVTRFPRRVFALDGKEAEGRTLAEAGLREGQELLLIESIS